jgi:glycerol kinase
MLTVDQQAESEIGYPCQRAGCVASALGTGAQLMVLAICTAPTALHDIPWPWASD